MRSLFRMTILAKAALLAVALLAGTAGEAGATLGIENHNDPAGDPTQINYQLESPSFSSPIPFTLDGGAHDYASFGVKPGTYAVQALPPAGWAVGDIQCVGPDPADFVVDVANGRVTVTHGAREEHICAFTNRKLSQGGPSPGVSPTPGPAELPKVLIPRRPALVGVTAGRGYAEATIRITRRSIIKGWLLRHKTHVVGRKRIVRRAGTHAIRVKLQPKRMRRMQRRGMERVTLTLRIAVTAPSGATHVFRHGVVVKL